MKGVVGEMLFPLADLMQPAPLPLVNPCSHEDQIPPKLRRIDEELYRPLYCNMARFFQRDLPVRPSLCKTEL